MRQLLHGAALSLLLLAAVANAQRAAPTTRRRTDPADGEHAYISSFMNLSCWFPVLFVAQN
jgi:hypothetical protein